MQRTERFERTETLISISTDGSVLEWTTKKGFAVNTLMQLKRTGMVSGLNYVEEDHTLSNALAQAHTHLHLHTCTHTHFLSLSFSLSLPHTHIHTNISYPHHALQGDGWISREAAGLAFDFVPSDPSTYVTGTALHCTNTDIASWGVHSIYQ